MTLTLPGPVAFDLNLRERANIEKTCRLEESGRAAIRPAALLLVSALSQTIVPIVRLARLHGSDPASWVLLVLVLALVALLSTFIFLQSKWARVFIVPVGATVVTFETSGLSVERPRRGARTVRHFSFDRIRSVRLLPQAIVVSSHLQRPLVIPRTALPGAGAELMAFFNDRLTGKRMLVRSPSSRTTTARGASTAG